MNDAFGSKKGKKCAIYIRVSSERQIEGFSIDGQRRYLEGYAEHEGMTVVDTYVEPGKSGKSIEGRTIFQKMLEDVSTGAIDIDFVIVFKLSRFGRNAKDVLNSLSHLQNYGVNLICKDDGLDSSTAMGRMMITILGAVAEMERENISTQTMLGREEKARQGGWNGGFAPYGYLLVDGKLEINEVDAEIVRTIFNKFVNDGLGYSTISSYFNKQGIKKMPSKNSHGRKFTDWNAQQIKNIIENPVYTGRIAFGRTKQEKIKGTENDYKRISCDDYILSDELSHEPIISEEIYNKATLKRNEKSVKGNPKIGRSSKHLLSGILKCPMCGSPMHSDVSQYKNTKGKVIKKQFYQCSHYAKSKFGECQKNRISAELIETEVIKYTKLLINNPQFANDIQNRIGKKVDASDIKIELENYQKQILKFERSKTNIEKDIDNIFDGDKNSERKRTDLNKRLDLIYDEIYDIENKIAECQIKKASIENNELTKEAIYGMLLHFDKLIDKMDKQDKRMLIEALISEVRLYNKETWSKNKSPIKEIKYSFPIDRDVFFNIGNNLRNVETIVKLSL